MKKVLILGCTGSIGKSTIDIIRNEKDSFSICGLQANENAEKLQSLSNEFNCKSTLTKHEGTDGIKRLISETEPDIVVNGISGAAGLLPSKFVLENKIDLALANKESVVMAWPLIKELSEKNGARIIPVDSEHSAIFCLINQIGFKNIAKIIITASGGPFKNYTKEMLENVTLEQALKHPTWNMGKKITIDSATLANKGLEVIEAQRLFNISTKNIKVTVHPQSFVHSMVQTNDGMIYAQIAQPDMKHPIINALRWPENKPNFLEPFDFYDKEFSFYKPNLTLFPMLKYAFSVAELGKSYTIAYNASNEIAVAAFIDKKISFTQIPKIVNEVLQRDWTKSPDSFEDVFYQDKSARIIAQDFICAL